MENEIKRLERRIGLYKKEVRELHDEIMAHKQLLDCAAANLILVLKDGETPRAISKEDVKCALGKYHLAAREEDGYYIMEIISQ